MEKIEKKLRLLYLDGKTPIQITITSIFKHSLIANSEMDVRDKLRYLNFNMFQGIKVVTDNNIEDNFIITAI